MTLYNQRWGGIVSFATSPYKILYFDKYTKHETLNILFIFSAYHSYDVRDFVLKTHSKQNKNPSQLIEVATLHGLRKHDLMKSLSLRILSPSSCPLPLHLFHASGRNNGVVDSLRRHTRYLIYGAYIEHKR